MPLIHKTETTTEDYTALNEKVIEHQVENNYALTFLQDMGEFYFNVNSLNVDNIYYEDKGDQDEPWTLILENVTVYNIPIDEKYKLFYLVNEFNDEKFTISQYPVLKYKFDIMNISEIQTIVEEEQKEYILQTLEKV